MYAERRLVDEFREMGVHGYILKNTSRLGLLAGLRTVLSRAVHFSVQPEQNLITPGPHADDVFLKQFKLTPAELAELGIIRLIRQGFASQEIANQLTLSYLTIKTHRRNIHFKLGTTTTTDLIRFAEEHGIWHAMKSGLTHNKLASSRSSLITLH